MIGHILYCRNFFLLIIRLIIWLFINLICSLLIHFCLLVYLTFIYSFVHNFILMFSCLLIYLFVCLHIHLLIRSFYLSSYMFIYLFWFFLVIIGLFLLLFFRCFNCSIAGIRERAMFNVMPIHRMTNWQFIIPHSIHRIEFNNNCAFNIKILNIKFVVVIHTVVLQIILSFSCKMHFKLSVILLNTYFVERDFVY